MESHISILSLLKWLGKAIAAGFIAIFVLSVFAWVYEYSGVHVKNPSGATDYTWQSGQARNTMTEGFAWIHMDESGYNNAFPRNGDVDILLMGSSHMEAVNINSDKNVGYLLNILLPEYYTYNIGISGHTIYRNADNIGAALEYYHPNNYVIIETSIVNLSIDEMNEVIEKTAQPIPSYDSGIIYHLQKIPAFKIIYKQLSVWISERPTYEDNEEVLSSKDNDVANESIITEEYEETLHRFLSIISDAANDEGIIPIIFFAPTEQIGMDGIPFYLVDEQYVRVYKETCEETGIVFIDMTDTFRELYEKEHVMAHGFSNTSVGVGHLNQFAHRAIAEALKKNITEVEVK